MRLRGPVPYKDDTDDDSDDADDDTPSFDDDETNEVNEECKRFEVVGC